MNYLEYSERLNRIVELAKLKSTGTPKELAYKLGISERTLYRMISTLKNQDHSINYSNYYRSYYLK